MHGGDLSTYPQKIEKIQVKVGTRVKIALANVADTRFTASRNRLWNKLALFIMT